MITNPTRSFSRILSPDFDVYSSDTAMGATCRYFTRETLLSSSARLKNEHVNNRQLSFFFFLSLSLSIFISLPLARTLDEFRSWSSSVGAPRRCSSRPSLVVPRGRSCPYSASLVVTGHPEELYQQEQFRALVHRAVYFVLFVRVSKSPYTRLSINQRATYLLLNTSLNI